MTPASAAPPDWANVVVVAAAAAAAAAGSVIIASWFHGERSSPILRWGPSSPSDWELTGELPSGSESTPASRSTPASSAARSAAAIILYVAGTSPALDLKQAMRSGSSMAARGRKRSAPARGITASRKPARWMKAWGDG